MIKKECLSLDEEFHQLLTEKKQAYAEYRQVKKEMQEYLIAKQTVEYILSIDRKKEEEKRQKEQNYYRCLMKKPRSAL